MPETEVILPPDQVPGQGVTQEQIQDWRTGRRLGMSDDNKPLVQRPDIAETIEKTKQIQGEEEAHQRSSLAREYGPGGPAQQLDRTLSSPHPQIPEQQRIGAPPDQRDYQKGSMAFMAAMSLVGAFTGRLSRAQAGTSLNAFAAGLNGWQQGNQQAYENATKQWEESTKRTLENNRMTLDKYKLLLADRSLTVSELSERMKLAAIERYDDQMYNAARQQNVQLMGKLYDMQHKATNDLDDATKPFIADIAKQRLYDFSIAQSYEPLVANNWIDPRTGQPAIDPRTNKPFDDVTKRYVEDQVKKYPAGTPLSVLGIPGLDSGTGGGGKIGVEYQLWRQEHPNGTLEEFWKARSQFSGRPPRNAPAIFMQKWMEEHPQANAGQVRQAMAIFNMTQSRMRTLGTRSANIDLAIDEGMGTAKLALQRSNEVPRGNFVPINEIKEKIRRGTSSPPQQRFDDANAAFITAYAQTMSRTGTTTVHSQQRAEALLNTATGPEAYKAGVEQLLQEMQIVKDAVRSVMRDTSEEGDTGVPSGGSPGSTGGAGGGGTGGSPAFQGKSDADILKELGLGQ